MRVKAMLPLVIPALVAQAEPPVANFASFNDWLGADAHGVRIGADGRLKLAPPCGAWPSSPRASCGPPSPTAPAGPT